MKLKTKKKTQTIKIAERTRVGSKKTKSGLTKTENSYVLKSILNSIIIALK